MVVGFVCLFAKLRKRDYQHITHPGVWMNENQAWKGLGVNTVLCQPSLLCRGVFEWTMEKQQSFLIKIAFPQFFCPGITSDYVCICIFSPLNFLECKPSSWSVFSICSTQRGLQPVCLYLINRKLLCFELRNTVRYICIISTVMKVSSYSLCWYESSMLTV